MTKGNLMNNTKTRRKGSMLQDNLSKIKYLFVLAVLLVLPMQAMAGGFLNGVPIIDQTDTGTNRIVAFWDTRSRDTFIQVTNTSDSKINIHVQVYDVNSSFIECEECNFDDMLTANDTHVYDIENIMTNGIPKLLIPSVPKCTEIGEDTYGFMVISYTGPSAGEQKVSRPLIGMFRVIDELGYEYRTNTAGEDRGFADDDLASVINFSSANGNSLSDLVGIVYASVHPGFVYASPTVTAKFGSVGNENLIWDSIESPTSCSPTTFACAVGALDKGIDNALPNSKGQQNRVCPSAILDSNTSGWLDLEFDDFFCFDGEVGNPATGECNEGIDMFFVGFIGLNNGDGTGSMDSWWGIDLSFLDGPVEAAF